MKKIKLLFLIFTSTLLITQPAFAVPDSATLDFYAENNIFFYDDSETTCSSSDGSISVYGSTVAEKIWVALTQFLTPEQAAGAMGNMKHESNGLNPAQHEVSEMNKYQPGFDLGANSSAAYGLGLIQWSFGRRVGMYNYVKEKDPSLLIYLNDYKTYSVGYTINGDGFLERAGEDATNKLIQYEIEYLQDELKASYSGIFNQTTVQDASNYWLHSVEKPADQSAAVEKLRGDSAQAYYDEFHSKTITGKCGAGLASYVLRYAWPEHHPANFVERMPDYAADVERRVSEGKYVGGSVLGVNGIDCGGFVTTLLQESGYDPDYNGYVSNTGPQEYWLMNDDDWIQVVAPGASFDVSSLQPGDVAFTGDSIPTGIGPGGQHTFIYVGNIEGFGSNIASASYDSDPRDGSDSARAPMAGHESLTANNIRWYRKVK